MLGDHPHRPSPQLRVDLLWHDVILLDSERDGIKPVTLQHLPVNNPTFDLTHQSVMVDVVESTP
jgi:hypothetical protein